MKFKNIIQTISMKGITLVYNDVKNTASISRDKAHSRN
jgi:hypothetical protein